MNKTKSGAAYARAGQSEKGLALVVSLVLLAGMTILGVTTLSGTRLNEQIASNAQQKSIAFEAAESGIETVSNYQDLFNAITKDVETPGNNPEAVTLPDTKSKLNNRFDLLTDGRGADISGELSVQYCGEKQPIGTNLSAEIVGGQVVSVAPGIAAVSVRLYLD